MILGQFFRIRLKNLNTYFVGCLQLHIDWDLCYCIGVVLAKYFAVMLGNDKLIARTAAVTQFDGLLVEDFVVAVVLRKVLAD